MRIGLVSGTPSATTTALASVRVPGVAIQAVTPSSALDVLTPGDVAVGRLDVRQTLDGVEDGLWALGVLAARGVTVLNPPGTLLATHDKLLTARVLARAGLPHPRTRHVRCGGPLPPVAAPVVLKPRHGSWGRHVTLCETTDDLVTALAGVRDEAWFGEHGAIVQELVPPTGSDLRLVVAGGRVVGSIRRVAPPGEWRTNVALGAERRPLAPPPRAIRLAIAAAEASGAALVGVDLLETPEGDLTVLELNGAVDFTDVYRRDGDVFREAVLELALSCTSASRPEHDDAVLV